MGDADLHPERIRPPSKGARTSPQLSPSGRRRLRRIESDSSYAASDTRSREDRKSQWINGSHDDWDDDVDIATRVEDIAVALDAITSELRGKRRMRQNRGAQQSDRSSLPRGRARQFFDSEDLYSAASQRRRAPSPLASTYETSYYTD